MVEDTFSEARQRFFNGTVINPSNLAQAQIAEAADEHSPRLINPDFEVEEEDSLSFEMYEKMVYENNDIIKWLAVDL